MASSDTQENVRFGRWTVISGMAPSYHVLCKSGCGEVRNVYLSALTHAKSKSCGCLHKEVVTTHGHNGKRTYKSYHSMKQRCLNSNHHAWEFYGGRGIDICNRWLLSFENFLEDMGERPEGTSLDRIDGDKGYSKTNCRWATLSEQNKNKRYGRKTRRTKDT